MNKKIFFICLFLFVAIGCASTKQIKQDVPKENVEFDMQLKFTEPVKASGDPDAVLLIKNKKTGKEWTITHEDFTTLAQGYSNWRVLEGTEPQISSVKQDDKFLYITFNYYDPKQISLLSGTVIISKDFMNKVNPPSKTKDVVIYSLSGYSVLTTLLLVIIIAL